MTLSVLMSSPASWIRASRPRRWRPGLLSLVLAVFALFGSVAARAQLSDGAEAIPPLPENEFEAMLREGDLAALEPLCRESVEQGLDDRLRRLNARLLALHPAPQPLSVVLANAEVLLSCRAPQAALRVLDRIGPASGLQRQQWLLLQWRAAHMGLDHRRAALALERLAVERTSLDGVLLPVASEEDGSVVSRAAHDLLADHLEAIGREDRAAEVLLAARQQGQVQAQRVQRAVRLLAALPIEERDRLLEQALEQAAAEGAWGLVAELLDDQAALPSTRAIERRLRLSGRLDDAYGEWLLRRQGPDPGGRSRQLELQLRSPRDPGGHAVPPSASPEP